MECTGVGAIMLICHTIREFYKGIIKKDKSKYNFIPIIVGISGGILGLFTQ